VANLGANLQAPGVMQAQNGDYLLSPNGNYFATIQPDGNLCVYPCDGGPPHTGSAIFCTLSASQCLAAYFVAMQSDGNLCVYSGIGDPFWLADVTPIWASWSQQPTSSVQCYLTLESDGDLNVYLGTPSSQGDLLWTSYSRGLDAARAKNKQ